MIRIMNFKVDGDIVSYDYLCEKEEDQKGSVIYDLKNEKIIDIKRAPVETEWKNPAYAQKSITYIDRMIKNNVSDYWFAWY